MLRNLFRRFKSTPWRYRILLFNSVVRPASLYALPILLCCSESQWNTLKVAEEFALRSIFYVKDNYINLLKRGNLQNIYQRYWDLSCKFVITLNLPLIRDLLVSLDLEDRTHPSPIGQILYSLPQDHIARFRVQKSQVS